eukprot:2099788-Rhodomonas_salina.3
MLLPGSRHHVGGCRRSGEGADPYLPTPSSPLRRAYAMPGGTDRRIGTDIKNIDACVPTPLLRDVWPMLGRVVLTKRIGT